MNRTEPPRKASKRATAGSLMALAIAGILASIYANEGGYVNHPNDPGGPTNYGITEKVARQWGYRGDMRDFPMHCTEAEPICSDEIYLRDYVKRPGFFPLIAIEPMVAKELVDTGANMGPSRPSRWFQQILNELGYGIAVDGRIGPQTIAAYREAQRAYGKVPLCVAVLDRLDARQKAEYQRLVRINPRLRVFYRGWINHRIGNVNRSECGKGWG